MENSLNQNSKSKIYDFSHHWIIPVLHATLWGTALYVAQKAGHVLGSTDDEKNSIISIWNDICSIILRDSNSNA